MDEGSRKTNARELLGKVLKDLQSFPEPKIAYDPSRIVLKSKRAYGIDDEIVPIIIEYLEKLVPELDASLLVEDFKSQNESNILIEDIYGSFDWPQSDSNRESLSVSAPGFTRDYLHALISVGTHIGPLFGSGVCYLYRRDKGRWTKAHLVRHWMS